MRRFDQILEALLDCEPAPAERHVFSESVRAIENAVDGVAFRARVETPRWALELGVPFPCEVDEARRAFRRLAFRTHPDRPGGSHDAFLRAQGWLEEALGTTSS